MRIQKKFKFEVKALSEKGEFEGFASTFGNIDRADDIIAKGAFTESLAMKPATKIKMLWQHDPNYPIGQFTEMYETEKGLYVKGVLFIDDIPEAKKAYRLAKGVNGIPAIDGMSIGFDIPQDGSKYDENGLRVIKKIDLWEISLVTFACNPLAEVTGVKNMDIKDFKSLRNFEDALRDSGHSKKEAQEFISGLKDLLRDSGEIIEDDGTKGDENLVEELDSKEWDDFCKSLKENNNILKGANNE